MFRHLRTKLTLLYAGLFALALTLVSVAVFTAIVNSAGQTVRRELVAGGAVFDRFWALRSQQLSEGARVLAGDFGFRSAVATGDSATIRSALENLRARLGIDLAFTMGVDGRIVSTGDQSLGAAAPAIRKALDNNDHASGAFTLGGVPYQAIAAPVTAPTTVGWVVFAVKLDKSQLSAVENLSAIPLEARALNRRADGLWTSATEDARNGDPTATTRFIDKALMAKPGAPDKAEVVGPSVALAKPFPMMTDGQPVVLLLRYPLARALAPYQSLIGVMAAVGFVGLLLVALGSWMLARNLTRPISALEDAAHRLENGEDAVVPVLTKDEIGRLSDSFNGMAGRIRARESELSTTKAFLDTVIDVLPNMVVVKDLQHRFVLVNQAGENLLGVNSADMLGKTDFDLFPTKQAEFFVDRDRAVLESGKLEIIAEEPIQTAANGLRYLQTKKIAIKGADGQSEYLVSISEDITERKFAAEALELARDQAEAANRAKSSFLANMSHEVRTPLNGVLGVASVLAGTKLAPNQKEMVGIIENSATVLQRVLSDVLDLARVEAGRLDIVPEAFDLEAAVRALAGGVAVQCQGKGLVFELDVADAVGAAVCADRVRLEQVLGNLLSNAVTFTETGKIALTVSRQSADSFSFEVRDSGIGFDPVLIEALFEPFRQEDSSITRRFGGTGLGLAISRELARAMGGDLTCDGEPGKGAAFTLVLPLAASTMALSAPAAQTDPIQPPAAVAEPDAEPVAEDAPGDEGEPQSDEAPLRVLLADDHATNRTVVELILNSVGVAMVSVENGAEAVDAFKAQPFDIVLMDMQMPVMDGLTAIELIRAYEVDQAAIRTPILVVSANAMAEHVEKAAAAGADGHVAKPITANALLAAMETALDAAAQPADSHAAAA